MDAEPRPQPQQRRGGNRLLRAALTYARLGYRVHPTRGKVPILPGWPDAATTDPDTIKSWWRSNPRANVGLALGRGLVALDIDAPDGEGSLGQLMAELGELPATVESRTPRGGRHLLYRVPDGTAIKNHVGLRPNLDVRADGGQIVVAPSVHPETGSRYQWREGHGPRELEPAELPAAWIEMLSSRPETPPNGRPGPTPSRGVTAVSGADGTLTAKPRSRPSAQTSRAPPRDRETIP